MHWLSVQKIEFGYSISKRIFKNFTLEVEKDQWILLIGPNAIGKSTLLKLILGFLKPLKGKIFIDHREVEKWAPEERAKRLSYLSQTPKWTFPYTALETIFLNAKTKRIAFDTIEMLGIQKILGKRLNEISGGERKLVFIAKTIAQDSDFLLLDEPFSNLDPVHKRTLWNTLFNLKEKGKGGILVSHELVIKPDFFDYILAIGQKYYTFGKPLEILKTDVLLKVFNCPLKILKDQKTLIVVPEFP